MTGRATTGVAVIAAMLLTPAVQATTLRCSAGVVKRGDSTSEVLARCGTPARVDRFTKELRVTNHIGIPVVHHVPVERWTYERGIGRFVQILVFESGLLQQIERGPRQ